MSMQGSRAVTDYAKRVLPELVGTTDVTSSLAPWMLAAAVAPAAEGEERVALTEALGLPPEDAARVLGELLRSGPEALRTAVALWRWPEIGDGLADWESSLPVEIAHGGTPSQATADAWTRSATDGLIERFPLPVTPETVLTLAAAICARISWDMPLSARKAPANAWGLGQMLLTSPEGVFASPVGEIAVARSGSRERRLSVYSLISAAGTSRSDLAAAALDLIDRRPSAPDWGPWSGRIALEDLPAEGHAWSVSQGHGGGAALVPAFEQRAEGADILGIPGVAEASAVLVRRIGTLVPPWMVPIAPAAAMSAMARYDRRGFEAAAVAALGVRAGASPQAHPVLDLRFDRPHLVIAVSDDEAWWGLPLFAAWVNEGVREPEAE